MTDSTPPPKDLPEKLRDFLLEEDSLDELDVTEEGMQGGSFVTGAGAKKSTSQSRYQGGEQLGEFRLLRLLGQGGMGEVWEAEQPSLGRNVALKLVLPGRVDERGLDLFAREARAGGRLSHPGIVSVYGAGSDGDTHWISMELVAEGCDLHDSLDDFKEQDPLPEGYFDEVTGLLASIADALEHAHDAGVIHRDIKPRNILITPSNEPKLTDFGLARITDEDALTVTGEFAGTYYYMSPEQAAARRAGLDHRTDIFSLGVVMYELLSLQRPFEGDTTYQVAQKIMFEDPPDLLSLRSRIPQPLAAICGKTLEKSRDRRYPTMGELAADLRRYLAREPVMARPPGRVRKTGLWMQRNPTKSALLGTGTLALVAISALAVRISDEKGRTEEMLVRAEAAEADALLEAGNALKAQEQEAAERMEAERAGAEAELARAEAAQRAEDLQQVADFQAEQLSGINVEAMGLGIRRRVLEGARTADERAGRDPAVVNEEALTLEKGLAGTDFTGVALGTLDEHVFEGALEALKEFENQPLVQAQLLQTVAETLRVLGLYARALRPQEQAVEIRKRELGDEHPDTLTSISTLSGLLRAQGKLDAAESLNREALETRRRVLGEEHPDTLRSINHLGMTLMERGKMDEAMSYMREGVEVYRRTQGNEHPSTLYAIGNMGKLLYSMGKHEDAEPLLLEALESRRRVLGAEHPDTLASINELGSLLYAQGRLADAEPLFREVSEASRHLLGNAHPRTLTYINNLGALLLSQGKHDEAEPLWKEALKASRRLLGDEHPRTLTMIGNMGSLFESMGKLDQAEPYAREALEVRRRVFGNEHPSTLSSISSVGGLLYLQGKFADAEPLWREALDLRRRLLGSEHPDTLSSFNNLGLLLKVQGRLEEAEPVYLEALEACRRTLGNNHHLTMTLLANIGVLLKSQNKLTEAEPYTREALAARRRVLGDEHPDTLISINNLGYMLYAQGRLAEAEPLLQEALTTRRRVLGNEHFDTLLSGQHLALLLQAQGKLDEAEKLAREVIRLTAQDSHKFEEREALLEQILADKASTEDEPNTDED